MKSELLACLKKGRIEAGCDEAGRGCLAGPVMAAAVILPEGFSHNLLDDSKKLSEKKRLILREVIEHNSLAWAVAAIPPSVIDEVNILNASIMAMHKAIGKLGVKPDFLLIDGHKFHPYPEVDHSCQIRGDGRFASIAAASVLAKTWRDEYMLKIDREYPHYDWKNNKGYPTAKHREGILERGISPYHRKSFRLLDDQLRISF
jgi:ribonuclease HII